MIRKLRRKFTLVCMLSLLVVLVAITVEFAIGVAPHGTLV